MAKGLSFAGPCCVFCSGCTVWKPDQKAPFLSLSDLLTCLPLVLLDLRPSPSVSSLC